MKTNSIISTILFLAATAAYADVCKYVEDQKNFEVGKHGALLVSYMNYSPFPKSGAGDKADRDDDQFGVCRIYKDGTIMTSYGCAGKDHVDKIEVRSMKTIASLSKLMLGNLDEKTSLTPYEEHFDDQENANLLMLAMNKSGSESAVKKNNALRTMIMDLCPLDNEPSHKFMVRKL